MSDELAPKPEEHPRKVSRHVMPLGMRVLVRLVRGEDRTASGLFLPAGAKDATASAAYGQVVGVARASAEEKDGFGQNVSGVPDGAFVLFPKEKGLVVPWDDQLRVLDVKDVFALVEEIDLQGAH